MKPSERITADNRPGGWRTSGRRAGLGVSAWVLALVVVALMSLGFYLLHGSP